jgi:hypothetical protein
VFVSIVAQPAATKQTATSADWMSFLMDSSPRMSWVCACTKAEVLLDAGPLLLKASNKK